MEFIRHYRVTQSGSFASTYSSSYDEEYDEDEYYSSSYDDVSDSYDDAGSDSYDSSEEETQFKMDASEGEIQRNLTAINDPYTEKRCWACRSLAEMVEDENSRIFCDAQCWQQYYTLAANQLAKKKKKKPATSPSGITKRSKTKKTKPPVKKPTQPKDKAKPSDPEKKKKKTEPPVKQPTQPKSETNPILKKKTKSRKLPGGKKIKKTKPSDSQSKESTVAKNPKPKPSDGSQSTTSKSGRKKKPSDGTKSKDPTKKPKPSDASKSKDGKEKKPAPSDSTKSKDKKPKPSDGSKSKGGKDKKPKSPDNTKSKDEKSKPSDGSKSKGGKEKKPKPSDDSKSTAGKDKKPKPSDNSKSKDKKPKPSDPTQKDKPEPVLKPDEPSREEKERVAREQRLQDKYDRAKGRRKDAEQRAQEERESRIRAEAAAEAAAAQRDNGGGASGGGGFYLPDNSDRSYTLPNGGGGGGRSDIVPINPVPVVTRRTEIVQDDRRVTPQPPPFSLPEPRRKPVTINPGEDDAGTIITEQVGDDDGGKMRETIIEDPVVRPRNDIITRKPSKSTDKTRQMKKNNRYSEFGVRDEEYWKQPNGFGYGLWWHRRYPWISRYVSFAKFFPQKWRPYYILSDDQNIATYEYGDPIDQENVLIDEDLFAGAIVPPLATFAQLGVDSEILHMPSPYRNKLRTEERNSIRAALRRIECEILRMRGDIDLLSYSYQGYTPVPDFDRESMVWVKRV